MKIPVVVPKILKSIYLKRNQWSHKGNFGRLLIIGGSKRYTGASGLAGMAALRTGTDLVTIAAPQRAADIIASFSPNLITYPLKGDIITRIHLRELLELSQNMDVVVIGSGIGRHKQTLDFVLEFLQKTNLPTVIDADAIHAFYKNTELLKDNYIITPHSKEFESLSGHMPNHQINNRMKMVHDFTRVHKPVILLKGHVDVIANTHEIVVNETGNPYMTVGGTGDVLAGICGAILSMKINPFVSACAAAYINGEAGNIAAKEVGISLTATDVINNIHKVIQKVVK